MAKRIMAVVFLAALLTLTACGGDSDLSNRAETVLDPKNPITVSLWHYYVGENKVALDRAISEFNRSIGIEKGIIVDALGMGNIGELEEAVSESAKGVINSKEMPDLFSTYPDKAEEIDKLGMLVDLNQYFTEEEQALYVEGFLKDGVFEGGRLLLIPVVKSTELFYLNETAWNEFEAATGQNIESLATWEGVLDTARSYYHWTAEQTGEGPWSGKAFMGFDSVANYIIVGNKQMGIDIIDGEQQKALLHRETLGKLFEIYGLGIGMGYFDAVGKFRSDDIKARELISYVGSSSGAAYFPTWVEQNNIEAAIDFKALSYPKFEAGEPFAVQQGAGMCIARSTPERELASAIFLKWFTDREQNIDFAMTTGYLPVQTKSFESDEFGKAIEKLKAGEKRDRNVAAVYEIVMTQILEANTYAAKPFDKSYQLRKLLEASLMDLASELRERVDVLKADYESEEEILAALGMEEYVENWLERLKLSLEAEKIPYSVE